MSVALRAIEVAGTVENAQLKLDEVLPSDFRGRVRVVVIAADDIDSDSLSDEQWLRGVSHLQSQDYVDDAEDDIYSSAHGVPFDAAQY